MIEVLGPDSSLMSRGWRPPFATTAAVAGLLAGALLVGLLAPTGAVPEAGWSVVPSPNEGPVLDDNGLSGLSCASTKLCTAVGWFADDTLIESWDGTRWSVVPSPNSGPASIENELQSVSCASASSCTAVGDYLNGAGVLSTLVESWDGTSWSFVPSPNRGPASGGDELQGVSCASATSCTAVGGYLDNAGVTNTLVESWDGASWSVVPSPNVPSSSEGSSSSANFLDAVFCASTRSCTAVGHYYYLSSTGVLSTLVESSDGARWSIVPSPNRGLGSDYLEGVSCVSASVCTAVGDYRDSDNVYKTLIEFSDGASWSVVPSPNRGPAAAANFLDGVSCATARSCAAVGYYYPASNGVYKTLVESWGGTRWSVVPSPNEAASGDNGLQSVSCASASRCTAVGWSESNNSVSRTLVETWTVPSAVRELGPREGADKAPSIT